MTNIHNRPQWKGSDKLPRVLGKVDFKTGKVEWYGFRYRLKQFFRFCLLLIQDAFGFCLITGGFSMICLVVWLIQLKVWDWLALIGIVSQLLLLWYLLDFIIHN